MTIEFVAIDFETANQYRASACEIGLIKVDKNGEVIDSFSSLIKPFSDLNFFNYKNIAVHGITSADVVDAPTWDELYQQVSDFIGDLPLVAHNMAFDGYVLADLCELYGFPQYTNHRFYTLRLARKLLYLEHNGLKSVYDHYFPGETFTHRSALADAEVTARIFVRMLQEYGDEEISNACPHVERGRAGVNYAKKNNNGGLALSELEIEQLKHYREILQNLTANEEVKTMLAGEHVCITGTLHVANRSDFQEFIAALGGIPEKGVTKKTTILIEGDPANTSGAEGAAGSRKMLKAKELKEKGQDIQILSESDFFHHLEEYS